jgi:hypothetical protein
MGTNRIGILPVFFYRDSEAPTFCSSFTFSVLLIIIVPPDYIWYISYLPKFIFLSSTQLLITQNTPNILDNT